MPSLIGVPYHWLSPAGDDSKCQKLSNGDYTPLGGGGKEREPVHAFGKLPNYHKLLKVQWEKTKAAIRPKVLMKNII